MPQTKLILTEPDVAQLIGSKQEQIRNDDGSASQSHPEWNPHPIQGDGLRILYLLYFKNQLIINILVN